MVFNRFHIAPGKLIKGLTEQRIVSSNFNVFCKSFFFFFLYGTVKKIMKILCSFNANPMNYATLHNQLKKVNNDFFLMKFQGIAILSFFFSFPNL